MNKSLINKFKSWSCISDDPKVKKQYVIKTQVINSSLDKY